MGRGSGEVGLIPVVGREHYRRLRFICAAVGGTGLVVLTGVYLLFPAYRESLRQEDGVVENLSAGLFLSTFVIGVMILTRERKGWLYAPIPAVGLLAFLDEVSFGQRVFGFSIPQVYGKNVDSSVHDFIEAVLMGSLKHGGLVVWGILGLLLGAACIWAIRQRWNVVAARAVQRHASYRFVLIAVVFIVPALVVDMNLLVLVSRAWYRESKPHLQFLEEACEVAAGLALLLAALSMKQEKGVGVGGDSGPKV